MLKEKHHNYLTFLSLLLVICLLMPSGVKLAHAFEDHAHEVCTNNTSTHLHKVDLDCEFYKFNISNSLILLEFNYKLNDLVYNSKQKINRLYNFKYNHQRLYFSLRGPPNTFS